MYEESVSLVMDRRLNRAMRDTVYWLYTELASRRKKGFTSESINGFRRFFLIHRLDILLRVLLPALCSVLNILENTRVSPITCGN